MYAYVIDYSAYFLFPPTLNSGKMSFSLHLRRLVGKTVTVLPRGARGWIRSASSWGKYAGGFQQESGESTAGGSGSRRWARGAFLLGVAASGGLGLLVSQRRRLDSGGEGSLLAVLPELQAAEKEKSELTRQERRKQHFKLHSSYMYKGEPYMTPRDFLESLTQDELRRECLIFYTLK